jgi:transcriptional regulator with XRE-family HTH domain
MNLGKAIKLLLEKKGLSQKELAEKINKSETSVSLILKNHTQPRRETLDSISNALGVKAEVLLLLSIEPQDLPDDKKQYWHQVEETLLRLFSDEKD